ncbi:transcriptional regulator [Virgisporangium aliadipatigenens]|uniref:Transcriptional regulator n=1 Tax=Virgisporangium aliadipatigenens TaxID=741659 RepID=A0A8J3YGH0_9ACTN|nr:helix-turn-helix transcriptional regulator [Virgisporangium aliadipatigenens]GIJ43967.1 transcriptional regulator [Virgisporangium aliadipatigenens]
MTSPAGPFGTRLRQWRLHRGLSQLGLAGQVGSTGRHISFLETGRSRPSRQMVLRLADALDVGRADANDLLHAAGLHAEYPTVPLDGADLAPYRAALDRMLTAHGPYPGLLLDGHWNVVAANDACTALFGPAIVGSNFVRDALTDEAAAALVVNWPEVAWGGVDRLRQHQRRHPFDPLLRELLAAAETALADVPRPDPPAPQILVCPWFNVGNETIRTIGMVARFDHPAETTLDDIHVELMYPMDDTAERFFRNRAAARNHAHDVENGDRGSDLTPTLHRESTQRKEPE